MYYILYACMYYILYVCIYVATSSCNSLKFKVGWADGCYEISFLTVWQHVLVTGLSTLYMTCVHINPYYTLSSTIFNDVDIIHMWHPVTPYAQCTVSTSQLYHFPLFKTAPHPCVNTSSIHSNHRVLTVHLYWTHTLHKYVCQYVVHIYWPDCDPLLSIPSVIVVGSTMLSSSCELMSLSDADRVKLFITSDDDNSCLMAAYGRTQCDVKW